MADDSGQISREGDGQSWSGGNVGMVETGSRVRRLAVVGGGISGLAAAHRFLELDSSLCVTLFEAGSRLGGVIDTVRHAGFLIERGADNFVTNVPWGLDLCRRLGIAEELLPTDESLRRAFVVRDGRLLPIPAGFLLLVPTRLWPLLTSQVLSPWGKLRVLAEFFVPRRSGESDESLASFSRRRLGREAFERLVQPLIGGIYTADADKLSLQATLPRFLDLERRFGGLIRGRRHLANQHGAADTNSSGARYSQFVAPREGLKSLVQALVACLPRECLRLETPVTRVERLPDDRWALTVGGPADGPAQRLEFDALVLALPAPRAAELLRPVDAALAELLARIPYAGAAVVSLGYPRDQIAHPLNGFGFVVPAIEGRRILAGSFASLKFPGRAPAGQVLIRVFLGGAYQPELLELPADQLEAIAMDELGELIGARGEPLLRDLSVWRASMPQYHLGHLELVKAIEGATGRLPNLALAGNAYRGVGISQCVHSGELAAERLVAAAKPATSPA